MNYFNDRFRQIKHSELPTISTPNGNVGMKCLPQPFNNFLDPSGSFAFYPNFNYSRIFENDMRNCRNSTNYLPPSMHGSNNIKQTGPPFCYHSGIPNTLYQNCYHNGGLKATHHPNFFYPPNFYPHPQPSRVTPPTEFTDSKLNLHVESSRPSHLSNHESNSTSGSSNTAITAGQSSSRNCSYIPHRPFQNPEALFWSSLNPAVLPKYPEKPPTTSESQSTHKGMNDSASIDKTHEQIASNQSDGSNFNRNVLVEDSNGKNHSKSASGHHKKSNYSTTGQFSRQAPHMDKTSRINFSCKSDVQTAEADSQSNTDREKIVSDNRPIITEDTNEQKSSVDARSPPPLPSSEQEPPPLLSSPSSSSSTSKQGQHKFDQIKCPLCMEQLQSNEQLDLHLRSHVDALPPPNLLINSTPKGKIHSDNKKKVVKKEVKVDGGVKGEEGAEGRPKPMCQCVGCPKTFTRVDKLKLHVSKRHPELLPSFYKCPHCQQGFEKCLALKQHLKTTHSGLAPKTKIKSQYTCEECGELLASRRDLVYHCMGHSGESPLSCPECGGKFTRPDKLRRHMFIHTGELPFTCSRCGQGFSRTDRLKEHTRLAHNESLLKCPSCDRVFDTWLQVKHHLKSHEYTCEECGESFTRKRKLQFHVMAHRTDKLLRCSECGIRFGHQSRLKKHIEFVHNSKVPLGRVSISDSQLQNSSEDISKIKVEPGCEPPEDIDGGQESWSYRLRRVEEIKKPDVAYADKTQDLDADEYEDDNDEDDGDDGSYEYDCRRGFNRKRKRKKKKSKFGRKFVKMHFSSTKVDSKEGILSKVSFTQTTPPVTSGIDFSQLVDIKKDENDQEEQITSRENKSEKSSSPQLVQRHEKVSNDNNSDGVGDGKEEDDDDDDEDTDVEGEVSTVYCSICYFGFSSSEELVRHSGEHLPPDQSHSNTYNGLPYRLPGDRDATHLTPNNHDSTHYNIQGHALCPESNQLDFKVVNSNEMLSLGHQDIKPINNNNNNNNEKNNCGETKFTDFRSQSSPSSVLPSSSAHEY